MSTVPFRPVRANCLVSPPRHTDRTNNSFRRIYGLTIYGNTQNEPIGRETTKEQVRRMVFAAVAQLAGSRPANLSVAIEAGVVTVCATTRTFYARQLVDAAAMKVLNTYSGLSYRSCVRVRE